MEPFVGRHNELQVLAEAYRSGRSALIPVYGRRRVGKSELILHFLKKKSGIYFAGKRGQPAVQIHEFLQEAARVLGEPLLAGLAAGALRVRNVRVSWASRFWRAWPPETGARR